MSESATASASVVRPQRKFIKRPDDNQLKASIENLRKEIKQLDLTSTELTNQINKHQIDKKVLDERNELTNQLKSLISKQGNFKQERASINDQIKLIDNQMKKKISEIQLATSKNNFKTVGEIDQRIQSLDNLIDSGNLKLADERRYVKEMSALRKLRKDFGSIEKIQISVDQDKIKISDLKKKLSSAQNKELNAQFESIQKRLDEINSSNKSVIAKRNELYDKRNAIKKQKDAKYEEIRTLKADFDKQMDKFRKTLAEEREKRQQEEKAQAELEKQQKRKEMAEQQLAEASVPAFTKEIDSIHNLLAYFDPTYVKPAKSLNKDSKSVPSSTSNQARKIEMPEDFVVLKKEQETFVAPQNKKSSKSKKSKAKSFTVDPDIIVALSDLSIQFPAKQEEVSQTVDILKETLTALEDKQEEQTKINIEKAKARIAQLEKEAEEEDKKAEESVEASEN